MKKNPKVSIIIPIYNGYDYISRCFDSILGNKYKNIEIIAINDGSKDKSFEILEDYKERYSDIFTIVSKDNSGIGDTRNKGIDIASGDYIMFVDQDDFIDSDYIITHVKEALKNDYDMVLSGYRRVNDEKTEFSVTLDERYEWSRYISIAPWGRIYKTSFLKDNKISFLVTPIGEDVYFNLQTNTLCKKIKIIKYIGYNWYQNNISVTNTISDKIKRINSIELLDKHYGILDSNNSINDLNRNILSMYFFLLIMQFLQWKSKNSTYKEIKDYYREYNDWILDKFPNYLKVNFFKLSKGDRFKIRMILFLYEAGCKLKIAPMMVYLYGKII